jgi:hypothetical protein
MPVISPFSTNGSDVADINHRGRDDVMGMPVMSPFSTNGSDVADINQRGRDDVMVLRAL